MMLVCNIFVTCIDVQGFTCREDGSKVHLHGSLFIKLLYFYPQNEEYG